MVLRPLRPRRRAVSRGKKWKNEKTLVSGRLFLYNKIWKDICHKMHEPNGEPVILRKPAAGAEGKEKTAVKSTVKRKALLCFLLLLTAALLLTACVSSRELTAGKGTW